MNFNQFPNDTRARHSEVIMKWETKIGNSRLIDLITYLFLFYRIFKEDLFNYFPRRKVRHQHQIHGKQPLTRSAIQYLLAGT